MFKKAGFLLVLVFLGVQLLSLLHMAEHGLQKHEHYGRLCDSYVFCEQARQIDAVPPVEIPRPVSGFLIVSVLFTAFVFTAARYKAASPRGPPALLG